MRFENPFSQLNNVFKSPFMQNEEKSVLDIAVELNWEKLYKKVWLTC